MIRPAKITLAAVIVLIGGGLALITGALASTDPKQNRSISLIVLLIGAWGLATGVGVLCLQRWARLSVLIFVGLTTCFIASIAPLVFVQIGLRPGAPEVTNGGRMIILLLCFLSLAAGLWCANVLSTKAAVELFGYTHPLQRLSVAVIGWCLVMYGIIEIMGLLRYAHSPRMWFGFVITGWSATAFSLFYTAVYLFLGVGLLRGKEQSRKLAIYYWVLQFLDVVVFYFRPDRETAVKSFYIARSLYSASSATSLPLDALSRSLRLLSMEWCIFALIALWFLGAYKNESIAAIDLPQRSADQRSPH